MHRLGALLAIASPLLWIGVTASGWLYLRTIRGITTVNYLDLLLLPVRREEFRQSLGRHHLAEASAALGRRDYERALFLFRAGLARVPNDGEARKSLAGLYLSARRPDLAADLLAEGLAPLAQDPAYVEATLRFFLENQQDQRLRELCEILLRQSRPGPITSLAARFSALAAFHRGDYDGAEALILRHQLRETADGIWLQARIDHERGYPQLALTHLEAAFARGLASDALYQLAGQLHLQLGHHRELELNATQRLAANPLDHAPWLDLLNLRLQSDQPARAAHETELYFTRFGHNQAALLALADLAATRGRPDLARRVEARFTQHGWPAGGPALMVAEACLASHDPATGLQLVEDHAQRHPERARQFGAVSDGLRVVALHALGRPDEARLRLDHLLARPDLRAATLHPIAQRLTAQGAPDLARVVLTRAVALDPLNQPALTLLVRLEAESADPAELASHLRRLLRMRKPSREVLQLAAARLGSDRHLLWPDQAPLLRELHAAAAPAAAF